jgi:hypothetical protein
MSHFSSVSNLGWGNSWLWRSTAPRHQTLKFLSCPHPRISHGASEVCDSASASRQLGDVDGVPPRLVAGQRSLCHAGPHPGGRPNTKRTVGKFLGALVAHPQVKTNLWRKSPETGALPQKRQLTTVYAVPGREKWEVGNVYSRVGSHPLCTHS